MGFVILPLLLLALVEAVLRVSGCGYSPDFFRRVSIDNTACLIENEKFGLRFFPPELARSPPPVVMKAVKPPGAYRIFLLGESAALGDPRPAFGAGRYLQALLRERFPGTEFEVICGAVTAINSHALLPIAQECARQSGDLWIIYMGNNEMIGPFGATTVFGAQSPPLWYVRLNLAVQRTRLGQLLMSAGRKLAGSAKHGPSWGGMQMFIENRIAAKDPKKAAVYEGFKQNLAGMLDAARGAGVPVILSTVAVNLRDCAPFGSLPDPALPSSRHDAQTQTGSDAQRADGEGKTAEALHHYEEAARIDPLFADLQFQWADCLLRSGNLPAARTHFELACDYDALPFRADSKLNGLVAQAAREHAGPGLALFDAVALFDTNNPSGIPGDESFYEHVHLNFDGNYRLALGWAERVKGFLPPAMASRAGSNWASQDVCERRLGLTDWNRYGVLEDVLKRLSQAPFTGQVNHPRQIEALRARMKELHLRMDKPAAAQARELYFDALRRAPNDHRLHENLAEFLEATGDLPAAASEWKRVCRLIPQHHLAYFQAGRVLLRQGQLAEAEALLDRALTMRPDLAEGWFELGNLRARQGKPELALAAYERERDLAPDDYRLYYRAGQALSKLSRGAESIDQYRHALTLRPDAWEARYALGEELALAGQTYEAIQQLEEVLRAKPDYVPAHLNLGVAHVRERQIEAAAAEFEAVLRLDPDNQAARNYLDQVRSPRP